MALKLVFFQPYSVQICAHFFFFFFFYLWVPCFVLAPEEGEMGYGLGQHETDGYKSPQTISKALMNQGDHGTPRSRQAASSSGSS